MKKRKNLNVLQVTRGQNPVAKFAARFNKSGVFAIKPNTSASKNTTSRTFLHQLKHERIEKRLDEILAIIVIERNLHVNMNTLAKIPCIRYN